MSTKFNCPCLDCESLKRERTVHSREVNMWATENRELRQKLFEQRDMLIEVKQKLAKSSQEVRDTRNSLEAYRQTMQDLFQKHLGAEAALLQVLRDPILTDQQARQAAVNILSMITPFTPLLALES